jgi:hypothetical protein
MIKTQEYEELVMTLHLYEQKCETFDIKLTERDNTITHLRGQLFKIENELTRSQCECQRLRNNNLLLNSSLDIYYNQNTTQHRSSRSREQSTTTSSSLNPIQQQQQQQQQSSTCSSSSVSPNGPKSSSYLLNRCHPIPRSLTSLSLTDNHDSSPSNNHRLLQVYKQNGPKATTLKSPILQYEQEKRIQNSFKDTNLHSLQFTSNCNNLEKEFDDLIKYKQSLSDELTRMPCKGPSREEMEDELERTETKLNSVKLELRKLKMIKT